MQSMQSLKSSSRVAMRLGFLLLFAGALAGCQAPAEEFTAPDWTPILAVPLVDTYFDLEDILNGLTDNLDTVPIETADGGVLVYLYEEEFSGTLAEEWLAIPDVQEDAELVLDEVTASAINVSPPGSVLMLSDTMVSEMRVDNPPGALVDVVDLAEGQLNFVVESTLGDGVEGQLTIPNLLDPIGMPWSVAWSDAMLDGGSFEVQEDLEGWRILPENPNVEDTNLVRAFFDVFVINDAAHTAQEGESLSAEFSMTGLTFERVEGDFGSSEIYLEEGTSSLSFVDDRFTVFGAELAEAALFLEITNAFGVEAILDSVDLVAFQDGVVVNELTTTAPALIVPPASGNSASPSVTTWQLDSENSNVASFMTSELESVELSAWVRSNPNGVAPGNPNFVDADGFVNAQLRAEVPLGFRVEQLDFLDTVDFDLDLGDEVVELDSAELRIILHNGFPFSVNLEVAMLDDSGTAIDSLSLNPLPIFTAPVLDEAGMVVEPGVFVHDFHFDWERADLLELATHAVLKVTSSTLGATSEEFVYLTEDQGLGLELSVKCFTRVSP